MNSESLNTFIAKIMNIHATTAGMGGASAGIFGTTSLGDESVQQLKRVVMAFASEYRKDAKSKATLDLAKEAEGLLRTLQVVSVITGERCDQLISELHAFLEQSAQSPDESVA